MASVTSSETHKARAILAVDTALASIATIALIARLYTRIYITGFVGLDDWWMLLAWILSIAQLGIWILYVHLGNGMHIWNIPPGYYLSLYKVLYAMFVLYTVTLGLIKISILTSYMRIFPLPSYRRLFLGLIVFVAAVMVGGALANLLECLPVSKNWHPSMKGHYVNKWNLQLGLSILSIVTDILILIIPVPLVWRLKLPFHRKIQIISVFGVGIIACAASIYRTTTIPPLSHSLDATYDGFELSICSSIELDLGMVCSSVLGIKPLLPILWSKFSSFFRGLGSKCCCCGNKERMNMGLRDQEAQIQNVNTTNQYTRRDTDQTYTANTKTTLKTNTTEKEGGEKEEEEDLNTLKTSTNDHTVAESTGLESHLSQRGF